MLQPYSLSTRIIFGGDEGIRTLVRPAKLILQYVEAKTHPHNLVGCRGNDPRTYWLKASYSAN